MKKLQRKSVREHQCEELPSHTLSATLPLIDTLKKAVKLREEGNSEKPKVGYWTPKKVFSDDQEKLVVEYLKEAADMFYSLSPKEVKMMVN